MVDGQEAQNEQTANCSRIREDGRERTGQGIARPTQKGDRRKGGSGQMGHVYFIETEDGRYVKIGYSANVRVRLSQLGTLRSGSFGLRIIGSFPGSPATEKWLHNLFANERDNSEWFRSSDNLRLFINTLKLTPPSALPTSRKRHISTRAVGTTQPARISNAAAAMGRKGGPARAKALSKAQRQEIAKKAAAARWRKKKD
jgi:hypothetical protein